MSEDSVPGRRRPCLGGSRIPLLLSPPKRLTSLKSCLVRLAGNETKHGFNRVGFGASGLRAGSGRKACMVGPSTPTFNLKPPGGAITPLCTERNTRDLCPRPRSQRLSYLSTSNPRRLPCLGSLQFGLGARRRDLDAQAPGGDISARATELHQGVLRN